MTFTERIYSKLTSRQAALFNRPTVTKSLVLAVGKSLEYTDLPTHVCEHWVGRPTENFKRVLPLIGKIK